MPGRPLIIAFLLGLVVFAGALWFFQTHAYYRDLPRQKLVIGGKTYPVADWTGTHATSSPLKLRACLTVAPETAAAVAADQPAARGAEPLVAPGWFECFDAKAITRDLEAGAARAYALGPTGAEGIDAWLALYPDGRAYKWHQLNPRYANQ